MDEKRQRRMALNREYQRNSRKRKRQLQQEMEGRLASLEARHEHLQMQLRIGQAGLKVEREEKQHMRDQMKSLLDTNAPEKKIKDCIDEYKQSFADYGSARQLRLESHMQELRRLLRPTQVTQCSLSSVQRSIEPNAAIGQLIEALQLTSAQQAALQSHSAGLRDCTQRVYCAMEQLSRLEQVVKNRNNQLQGAFNSLQDILMPKQAAKFILWVRDNPAFMYMLNKLVDPSLQEHNQAEEGAGVHRSQA